MSKNSKSKVLFNFLASMLLVSISWTNTAAQCGGHLKRIRTQAFPYSGILFDRAEDMTGDGLPDLLASESPDRSSFSRSRTFIIPNLGAGLFGTATNSIQPPASNPIYSNYRIINLNNDVHKDVVLFYGSLSGSFIMMVNNGNGTYTARPLTSVAQVGQFIDFFDVDGDGFDDYIGRLGSGPWQTKYSPGNGDGTFDPPVLLFDHTPITAGGTGDLDGNGKKDFYDSEHFHLNQGAGVFGTTSISSPFLAQEVPWGYGDFNVDGKVDILVARGDVPRFTVLTSTGAGFSRTDHTISSDPTMVGTPEALGNYSGNSAPDIAFNLRNFNTTLIYVNDGAGNFTAQAVPGRRFPRTEQSVVNGDFDNDGYLDQVLGTSESSNSMIMLSDVTSFTFLKGVCDKPGQTRIVDFDHSQTTDWSFWNPSTGDWSYKSNLYNSGPTFTQETVNWGLGSLGDIPTPGDFDGDGVTDRAVYRNSTGVWYIRRSSDLAWYVLQFGLTGDKPVAGDFDGDTKTDIAVWRPSDGNWYIWYMGTQTYAIVHFGLDGDKPAPADYDGDLKTDIAVYRPSSGVWYYLNSTNGVFAAVQWGIDTDRPLPADFDGDGKADITVFRPSNQIAYILRSTNSSANYYQVGIPGDIPQIGDYDGDFVADIGVYRPSNRAWWTSASQVATQNFGADGAIPTSSLVKSE